jgi:ABC-type uncharacterized transport system auxiliary subunit
MRLRAMRAFAAALPLGALAAAGCIAGPAPEDHFYRLEAGRPSAPLATPALPGSLRVEPLRTDALTRGTALLYRDPARPSEVRRYPYHRWADSPTTMIQAELIRFLREAGVAELVLSPELGVRPDYVLTGRIVRMERLLAEGDAAGSSVLLELEFNLSRASGRELLFHETYREQSSASKGAGDAASALNRALAAVFERLLADLGSL